jgi:hypothetical protein
VTARVMPMQIASSTVSFAWVGRSKTRRPGHEGVFIGEYNRGGGVAVATTNLIPYEEARR